MTVSTTYKSHVIVYNEDGNNWRTNGDIDLTASSLTALKKKIDELETVERRLGKGVELIYLGQRYGTKEIAPICRATMLDNEDLERYPRVWVSHADKTREKVGFHALCLKTQENVDALTKADELDKQAAAIRKQAEATRAGIKRITVDQIKALALETKPQ